MRDTNRGVVHTQPNGKQRSAADFAVSIDWLEFTVCGVDRDVVAEQILQLPASQFVHTGGGNYGYREKYVLAQCKHIVLLTDGTDAQGIHVILSGQGCAYLLQSISARQLLENVLAYEGHFTRIDLALDDKECVWYSVPQLIRYIGRRELVSRWKEVSVDTSKALHNGEARKEVVYLGSLKSDFSLRVYNKTLEQRKALLDKEAIAALPERWVRWEFTCRRRQAQQLALELLERDFALGEVFADLLCGSMRLVCSDGNDRNRSRWPMREKWRKFIGAARPLRLYVPPVEKDLQRTKGWLKKYVAPTVAAMMQSKDGVARFLEMLAEGQFVVKPQQWARIADYNRQVQHDTAVQNVVRHSCVPYVQQLLEKIILAEPQDNPQWQMAG